MSHSPDSTLSANSSLTDCGNSGSGCESVVSATCKRKRDCESGTGCNLVILVMARHNKPPYQGLAWNDERLWFKIAKASKSSLRGVVPCVTYYGELYRDDQTLFSLTDEFLRNNVLLAFEYIFAENSNGRVDLQDLYSLAKAVKANLLPKLDVRPRPYIYHASSSSEGEVVGYAVDLSGQELLLRNARAMQKEKGKKEQGQGQNQMVLLPTSNELTYLALQNEIGYKLNKEYGYVVL